MKIILLLWQDARRLLMRNHLMFAHPEYFKESQLAMARIKRPLADQEQLQESARGPAKYMRVSLLPVERIHQYQHLRRVLAGSEDDVVVVEHVPHRTATKSTAKASRATQSPKSVALQPIMSPGDLQLTENVINTLHKRSDCQGLLYGCYYCKQEFGNTQLAREHLMTTHHTKEPIVINLTQKATPVLSRIYLCTDDSCRFSTIFEERYVEHILNHDANPNDYRGRYKCVHCTTTVPHDKQSIQEHLFQKHSNRFKYCIDLKNQADKKSHLLYFCPYGKCSKTSYTDPKYGHSCS